MPQKAPRPLSPRNEARRTARFLARETRQEDVAAHNKAFVPKPFNHAAMRRSKHLQPLQ